ncbi:hypothetical protein KSC_063180 [Ktedonobacter sp. SOSP1-52]|nr:hypothetical protein KSC_063180 [Ktedonobacter sp. SOSP1-52]
MADMNLLTSNLLSGNEALNLALLHILGLMARDPSICLSYHRNFLYAATLWPNDRSLAILAS